MHPLPDAEIREQIARYLTKEIDRESFCHWFYPVLWAAHPSEPATFRLASQVGILLSEHDQGHRSIDEVKAGLSSLLATVSADIRIEAAQ